MRNSSLPSLGSSIGLIKFPFYIPFAILVNHGITFLDMEGQRRCEHTAHLQGSILLQIIKVAVNSLAKPESTLRTFKIEI